MERNGIQLESRGSQETRTARDHYIDLNQQQLGTIYWLRVIKQELGGPGLASKQVAMDQAIKLILDINKMKIIDLKNEDGVWGYGREYERSP